ncbi:MAG: metallophosphoesterase family protein [Candidatus Bathyarchaeia archaeon]
MPNKTKLKVKAMMLIALSDIHKSEVAVSAARTIINRERPDLILVAGDISHNDLEDALRLLKILGETGAPTFFVPGNMDSPRLSTWRGESPRNLHGDYVDFRGYSIVGLGGSINTPFKTPFEFNELEASEILRGISSRYDGEKLILLTHCPPKGTKTDVTRFGVHAGSQSVREFVEKKSPILVICGHIHEAQGTDMLGGSFIVNPGPAYHGDYARITLNEEVYVELAKFNT